MSTISKKEFKILFENDDFFIISKPAGLLSIPDRFNIEKENLYNLLKLKWEDLFIVHRLDRETSGIICFAKNANAHKLLSLDFENRKIDKRYLALCNSIPLEETGIIDIPIAHSQTHDGRMITHSKGKPAETKFKIKEQWRGYSLIEIKPETGRTHQIRVHMAYIGCPILCDPFYGITSSLTIDDIKKHSKLSKNDERFRPLIERTALHAFSLSFRFMNTDFYFEVEMPKDMKAVVSQLNKWQKT